MGYNNLETTVVLTVSTAFEDQTAPKSRIIGKGSSPVDIQSGGCLHAFVLSVDLFRRHGVGRNYPSHLLQRCVAGLTEELSDLPSARGSRADVAFDL